MPKDIQKTNSSLSLVNSDTNKLLIKPNPAKNKLIVDGIKDGIVKIFTINGKLVVTKDLLEDGKVDIADLVKGVYIIKVFEAKSEFTTKFLKE